MELHVFTYVLWMNGSGSNTHTQLAREPKLNRSESSSCSRHSFTMFHDVSCHTVRMPKLQACKQRMDKLLQLFAKKFPGVLASSGNGIDEQPCQSTGTLRHPQTAYQKTFPKCRWMWSSGFSIRQRRLGKHSPNLDLCVGVEWLMSVAFCLPGPMFELFERHVHCVWLRFWCITTRSYLRFLALMSCMNGEIWADRRSARCVQKYQKWYIPQLIRQFPFETRRSNLGS